MEPSSSSVRFEQKCQISLKRLFRRVQNQTSVFTESARVEKQNPPAAKRRKQSGETPPPYIKVLKSEICAELCYTGRFVCFRVHQDAYFSAVYAQKRRLGNVWRRNLQSAWNHSAEENRSRLNVLN